MHVALQSVDGVGREPRRRRRASSAGSVLVVDGTRAIAHAAAPFCDFLGVALREAEYGDDIARLLDEHRPIAVLCRVEPGGLDGFVLLKLVAAHDASLPVMLVTGEDGVFRFLDMVEESWGLSAVSKLRDPPRTGVLMDFLCRAGVRSGTGRAMPVGVPV